MNKHWGIILNLLVAVVQRYEGRKTLKASVKKEYKEIRVVGKNILR